MSPVTDTSVPARSALRLDDPGDVLSLVYRGFGYLPENAVVIVGLYRHITGAYLRLDYRPESSDPVLMSEYIAQLLAGPDTDPCPDTVLVVFFQPLLHPETPAQTGSADLPALLAADTPQGEFLSQLENTLWGEHRVQLGPGWCLRGRWMRNLRCADPGCCPPQGTFISQLPGEDLEPAPAEQVEDNAADPEAISAIADPQLRSEAFLNHLYRLRHDSTLHRQPAEEDALMRTPIQHLGLWDELITQLGSTTPRTKAVDPIAAQQLRQSLGTPGLCEAVLVLSADSLGTATSGLTAMQGRTVPSADLQRFAAILAANTTTAPDWPRINALAAVLLQLVPESSADISRLVGIQAWIEWVRGQGSASATLVGAINASGIRLESFPRLIQKLTTVHGPATWAQNRHSSHSFWQAG